MARRFRPPREKRPKKPRGPKQPGERYYLSDGDDGAAGDVGCVVAWLLFDALLGAGCCSLRLLALLLPAWGLYAWLR